MCGGGGQGGVRRRLGAAQEPDSENEYFCFRTPAGKNFDFSSFFGKTNACFHKTKTCLSENDAVREPRRIPPEREIIFIELFTSDHKLQAPRKG